MMIVFSKEFDSEDPFIDAVQAARYMSEDDVLSFCPHMGIASGLVTVGYVGTAVKYNCSTYGAPIALAARCAEVRPKLDGSQPISSVMVFPAGEWEHRNLDEVFPSRTDTVADGTTQERGHPWELLPPRTVDLKNIGSVEIREIINPAVYLPSRSAEDRARGSLKVLSEMGRYWPRRK